MVKKVRGVLVTGATGYIGANLTRRLLQLGFKVGIIKRSTSMMNRLDFAESKLAVFDYDGTTECLKQIMLEFKPELVYHLASEVIVRHRTEDIEKLVCSNILFGVQLLESMQLNNVKKIINTSTFWQTGGGNSYNPQTLYTASKQAFEDMLHFYANGYDIRSISLRLPDTYGPNDNRPKILNLVKKAAQSGEILNMSPGEQEMDLVYIDDIVDGFIHAASLLDTVSENFNVYSLSSGKPIYLRRIVEKYIRANGDSVNIKWGALPYRKNEILKIDVPRNILPGWRCKVDFGVGLRRMKDDAEN